MAGSFFRTGLPTLMYWSHHRLIGFLVADWLIYRDRIKDELKWREEGVIVGLQNLKTTVWEVC